MRAPKVTNIEWNEAGWNQVLTTVIQKWAVPKAEAIAEACNESVKKQMNAVLAEEIPTVEGEYRTKADRRRAEINREQAVRRKKVAYQEPPDGKRDYMISVEGSNPLNLNDYRATVITVTNRAKIDNARNNTLVTNLHLAGGE